MGREAVERLLGMSRVGWLPRAMGGRFKQRMMRPSCPELHAMPSAANEQPIAAGWDGPLWPHLPSNRGVEALCSPVRAQRKVASSRADAAH